LSPHLRDSDGESSGESQPSVVRNRGSATSESARHTRLTGIVAGSLALGAILLVVYGCRRAPEGSASATRTTELAATTATTTAVSLSGSGTASSPPPPTNETPSKPSNDLSERPNIGRDSAADGKTSNQRVDSAAAALSESASMHEQLTIAANARRQRWISTNLQGHYHEGAESAGASIQSEGIEYHLLLDAPQAKFTCKLAFDENGDPRYVSACKVRKYDALGAEQTDVYWWTNDSVTLKCRISNKKEICQGTYTLHYTDGSGSQADSWPPEKRTMRIERRL
jgi:hypothetical protein